MVPGLFTLSYLLNLQSRPGFEPGTSRQPYTSRQLKRSPFPDSVNTMPSKFER